MPRRLARELGDLRRQQRAFIDDLFGRGKPRTRIEYEICLALVRAIDSIRTEIEVLTDGASERSGSHG